VAVTAAFALAMSWRPAPDSLSVAQIDPGTIVVQRQPYDDSRDVDLVPTQGAAAKLLATASGILTSSKCRPGAAVESGKPVAVIGNRRVVALATKIPPYRTITVGTSGTDVRSLRNEFTRLKRLTNGKPLTTPADAQLIATARHLSGLDADSTETASDASLPPGAFAWMPTSTGKLATCDLPVGAKVSAGTPLSTLSAPLTELVISAPPADAAAGPRLLELAPVTVKLADSRITEASDLARLMKTPAWEAYELSSGQVPLVGQWKLSEPIQVASLPAASLLTAGASKVSDKACVSTHGRPVPVTIVASSLGRTLVTFPGTWPDTVDTTPKHEMQCR